MSWDDLHEPKGTEDRFKGGGGSQKPPFEIPKTNTPKEANKKNVKSTTTLKL